MIFTDQEYRTLLYAVSATSGTGGMTADHYNRLSALSTKLMVMREMDKAARTEKVMRDMLDALKEMFHVDPAYFPAGLCDPGENLEALLEELGGA